MSRKPAYMLDDDEDDEPEVTPYPNIYARAVGGDKFAPTFEKCPHCDQDGNVIVSKHVRRVWDGSNAVVTVKDHCHHCRGVGFLNVPTDEATKERLRLAGESSDLVTLMRARYLGGLPLFQPSSGHVVRTDRHELAVIEDDDGGCWG